MVFCLFWLKIIIGLDIYFCKQIPDYIIQNSSIGKYTISDTAASVGINKFYHQPGHVVDLKIGIFLFYSMHAACTISSSMCHPGIRILCPI